MSINPGLQIPYGIQPTNAVPVDAYSGPFTAATVPLAIAAANAGIPSAFRFQSMDVRLIVDGQSYKYWYAAGTLDANLVEFVGGPGATGATGASGVPGTSSPTTITLTGDVTGSGTNSVVTSISNAIVVNKTLTGYSSAAGVISSDDSIVSAVSKLDGNNSLKAPISNPIFDGTVSAPAILVNNKLVATQNFAMVMAIALG